MAGGWRFSGGRIIEGSKLDGKSEYRQAESVNNWFKGNDNGFGKVSKMTISTKKIIIIERNDELK